MRRSSIEPFARRGIALILLGLGVSAFADPQSAKDEGVEYGRNLLGTVQGLPGSANPSMDVPGYGGSTTLPQTQYYTNQDLGALQNDAVTGVLSGSAGDAATLGYELSLQPNIPLSADDPLITGAAQTASDALASPDAFTIKTGSCTVSDQASTETTTEHCTAWLQPTTHTCSRTLNVDVSWTDVSNCPLGQAFNQQQTSFNALDTAYARPYCNPGSGSNAVELQVYAAGAAGACTGWTSFTASTSIPTLQYTGVVLKPHWYNHCRPLPVFISGGCNGTQCNYRLEYWLIWFYNNTYDENSGDAYSCFAGQTKVDLSPYGISRFDPKFDGLLFGGGLFNQQGAYACVQSKGVVNLSFEKPTLNHVSTVTESWSDGCGYLEAQVQ